MKVRPQKQACGCMTIGPRYQSMCAEHQTHFDATHARWARERAAGNHTGTFIHTLGERNETHRPS